MLRAFVVAALLPLASFAHAAPRSFGLHVVWLEDAAADRADVDAFYDCLLRQSNFFDYWGSEATITYRGSFVVPRPPSLPLDATAAFVAEQIDAGSIAPMSPDETPIYLVHGNGAIGEFACGRYQPTSIAGVPGGVAQIHVSPPCWPGTTTLRNVTQTGMHELTELIDTLIGYGGCAGNYACAGNAGCEGSCDNLVGLACPNAPTQTPTGCGQQILDGFVVQKLGYAGRDNENCLRCFACDFTPGPAGSTPPGRPASSDGCGGGGAASAFGARRLRRRRASR